VHHIATDRIQRAGIVQVDNPLGAGLPASTARLIVALAHCHLPPAVRDIGQLRRQSTSPGRSPPSGMSRNIARSPNRAVPGKDGVAQGSP
jgi:hypothetical protein